ncbi:MAG: methyltransferase domain-containing protein [Ilumatobacteraceae bacterium]|jgi:SAM-dependent methyltransferase
MNPNQGQVEAWNGGESVHYVTHADRYDRQLASFTSALLEQAAVTSDDVVLDIGCGCGVTTLLAAADAHRVLGLDISNPLIEIAARRAAAAGVGNAEFIVADAQTHPFADGEFTLVMSQFGLMFFDDPEGAFENIRRSLAPGGRLSFVCWQDLQANEWLRIVSDAVADHADVPEFGGRAAGPGMFALKRPDETVALLTAAGFTEAEVAPIETSLVLGGGGTVEESLEFLLGMGMVRGVLGRVDGDEREQAIADVRSALAERHVPDVGVTLGAAGWLASARN